MAWSSSSFIVVLAILGNEQAALQQNLRLGFTNQPPGAIPGYPLGTDALGRDCSPGRWSGGGCRSSWPSSRWPSPTVIGTTVGVISGYAGGRVDTG